MTRAKRKQEHIEHALSTGFYGGNGFQDIRFVHQSLPDLAFDDVQLATQIGELSLSSPILINAMTGGGGDETETINKELSIAARETETAMAVGSQMSALKDKSERRTYEVVRKENPNGVIIANLGSEAKVEQAREAVDMIEADALHIHLNVIQELVMPEGDRDFRYTLERIHLIQEALSVPVIIKEVGFGLSTESVKRLGQAGITLIDTGGKGGTNFSRIENKRRRAPMDFFDEWGVTTAVSIAECVHASKNMTIIGSGGIRDGLDGSKAIALGASAVGYAGSVLAVWKEDGVKGAISFIEECKHDLQYIMTALGAPTIQALQQCPLVIGGDTWHWLQQRGVTTEWWSRRSIES